MSTPPNETDNFNAETSQFLRIPINRIGAVIGLKGSNKQQIEEVTKTQVMIDSETGEVEIRPGDDLKDPVQLFNARDIVKAIGRGFTLEQAIQLAEDEYYLEIIRLKQFVPDKPNHLRRVRSRLIGTKGRTRKTIEELTKTKMMVSGSTVSLIGSYTNLSRGKEAVLDIINGAKIESVLGRLEDERNKVKREEEKLWESEDDVELDARKEVIEDPFEDYQED